MSPSEPITSPWRRKRHKWHSITAKLVGLTILVAGAGMIVATAIEEIDQDEGPLVVLFLCSVSLMLLGWILWRSFEVPDHVRRSDVFVGVTASWIAFSLVAMLPFLLTGSITRIDDALFETISGFTTTGATILTDIEALPRGVLFWRSMTQWFGGIGIIVLAVSVLSFYGVGGMNLLTAEAPGPASSRLVPRVRETARRLFLVYLLFTAIIVVGYLIGGMSVYDAFAHAFTTISTGGFSPYNDSFAHFQSAYLQWFAFFGMFIAGGSFALYWLILTGAFGKVWRSAEARAYVLIAMLAIVLAIVWNVEVLGLSEKSIRQVAFTVMSIGTSTGYGLLDYELWAGAPQVLLLFLMALGGMAGSTAGGFKTLRLLAVVGYARRVITKQIHPNAVRVVKLGKDPIPEDITSQILGFMTLFAVVAAISMLLVAASGAGLVTSIGAVVSAIGNVGPGFGAVGPTETYLNIPPAGRGVLMVLMLLGRLEMFPILLALVTVSMRSRRFIERRLPVPTTKRRPRVSKARSGGRQPAHDGAPLSS